MLNVSDLWKEKYPGAGVACMVLRNVSNPEECEELEDKKREIETELCKRFNSKEQVENHSIISRYEDYYKRYKKTYHVRQQLETIVFKGKKIPRVAGLVEAMFMAELKNCLLTAGHDYDTLRFPLHLDIGTGTERYVLINGKEQFVKEEDMMISDTDGVISSIIHGPDSRTRITPSTRKAVFIVYSPVDISQQAITEHLYDIYSYVQLVSPLAEIEFQKIYTV